MAKNGNGNGHEEVYHKNKYSIYSNSGEITLPPRTGEEKGQTVKWVETEGGEIRLTATKIYRDSIEKSENNDYFTFGQCKEKRLTETEQLAVLNNIIVHYRPTGITDINKYYTVAAGVTSSGNLFVASNNEKIYKDSFYGRGCAETNMLNKCQKGLRKRPDGSDKPVSLNDKDVIFDSIYLMAGQADKTKDGKLVPKNYGSFSCLCGECRRDLLQHTHEKEIKKGKVIKEGTKFIMVPTNNGENIREYNIKEYEGPEDLLASGIIRDQKRGDSLTAIEISHRQMFPLKRRINTKIPYDVLEKGYEYIIGKTFKGKEAEIIKVPEPVTEVIFSDDGKYVTTLVKDYERSQEIVKKAKKFDMSFPTLGKDSTIVEINAAMTDYIKTLYEAHILAGTPDIENIKIKLSVLQTHDNKFFGYPEISGTKITAVPGGFAAAAAVAGNIKGYKAAYETTFNPNKILRECKTALRTANANHKPGDPEPEVKVLYPLEMPNSSSLGRLDKKLKDTDDPFVTIFPPNSGNLTKEMLESVSVRKNVREIIGPPFRNPKRELEVQGVG